MTTKQRLLPWMAVGLMVALPLLGGCESKQQREENVKLKAQVQTLTQEKGQWQQKVDAAQQEQAKLTAQVNELTQKVADAEAKLAAAAKPAAKAAAKPAAKPAAKAATKPAVKK
jgi:signal transduction histidine kinase